MIRRESFINKIRELNYTFKTKQKRSTLSRKVGGTHRISVPLADLLDDEYASNALRQAGCADDEIRAFLASAKY